MPEPNGSQSMVRHALLNVLGVILGLFFGIPPALGAHSIGLPWMPYCVGVLVIGLAVGLLFAFIVTAIHLSPDPPVAAPSPILRIERSIEGINLPPNASRDRLEQEIALLDRLVQERMRLHNIEFGKAAEQRIVLGELLDLELQDIDEQLSHLLGNGNHPRVM